MAQARTRSSSRAAKAPNGRAKAAPRASTRATPPPAKSGSGGGGRTAVMAVLGTAAGVVGGAVVGRRLARRPKRVLGVKVPGTGGGIDNLAKEIGRAGKHLGELAEEVRAVRKKAEKVSDAIS